MADHNQLALPAQGDIGRAGNRCRRLVVLGDRFESFEEFPAGRGDLPSLVVAQQVTTPENIDGGNSRGKTLDPRAPFRAAGGEDGDVSVERNERGPAAVVTGQDLQNGNL